MCLTGTKIRSLNMLILSSQEDPEFLEEVCHLASQTCRIPNLKEQMKSSGTRYTATDEENFITLRSDKRKIVYDLSGEDDKFDNEPIFVQLNKNKPSSLVKRIIERYVSVIFCYFILFFC